MRSGHRGTDQRQARWRQASHQETGHQQASHQETGHQQAGHHDDSRTGAGQQGAGSVLVLGLLSAVVMVTVLTVPLLGLLVVAQGVQNAADAAALAVADTASGAVSGFPCAAGARAAALNGASVTDCRVEGLVATVTVQRDYLGFVFSGRARAGPPPGRRAGGG